METEKSRSEEVAEEIAEVVEDAVDAAEARAEVAEETVAEVLEAAEKKVERAEENAERIAEAAIEGERGRRIETLERELGECRMEQTNLRNEMTVLSSQVEEMRGQLAATATIAVAASDETMGLSSSTPDHSETPIPPSVPEAIAEVEEILPVETQEEAPSPSENTPAARKARRWM